MTSEWLLIIALVLLIIVLYTYLYNWNKKLKNALFDVETYKSRLQNALKVVDQANGELKKCHVMILRFKRTLKKHNITKMV